jgi:hypothetical protein
MAKEGFKIARIQMDRVKGEVTAVAYRYVGVEEVKQSEHKPQLQKTMGPGRPVVLRGK